MNTFVVFKKYDYSFHFTMYQIIHVCLSICSLVTIVEMLFRSIYIQLSFWHCTQLFYLFITYLHLIPWTRSAVHGHHSRHIPSRNTSGCAAGIRQIPTPHKYNGSCLRPELSWLRLLYLERTQHLPST